MTAQPKNKPITSPTNVPSSEMITDSHRMLRAQLAPAHADRTQQPELARPLVDRERERVGDADEGDDHRQEEHHVDQAQELVDLRRLRRP